ncbi:MAG: hypothetical protein V4850_01710 [Myxococcota bacterium]
MDDDELDRSLRALTPRRGPPALDEARVFAEPAAPAARRRPWIALAAVPLALAAAAVLAVRALLPSQEAPARPDVLAARGAADRPTARVELRLYAVGDPPERVGRGAPVAVGTAVFFEVAADAPAEVRVWAEEPTGAPTPLSTITVATEATMLSAGEELLAWTFDRPGRVVFHASATAGCDAPSCDTWEVEVR